MRIKLETDSGRWTKAPVDKEIDIRSYKVRTEDGRTCSRNRRHLRLTREPLHKAPFPDASTSLHHQDQLATSPKRLDCPVPKPISVEIPESPTVAQAATTFPVLSPLFQFLFLLQVHQGLLWLPQEMVE